MFASTRSASVHDALHMFLEDNRAGTNAPKPGIEVVIATLATEIRRRRIVGPYSFPSEGVHIFDFEPIQIGPKSWATKLLSQLRPPECRIWSLQYTQSNLRDRIRDGCRSRSVSHHVYDSLTYTDSYCYIVTIKIDALKPQERSWR